MTSSPFVAWRKDAGRRRAKGLASGLLIVAATATLASQGVNWNLAGAAPAQTPLGERTKRLLDAMTSAQRYHSTLFPEHRHPGNPITESLQSTHIGFEPGVFSETLGGFLDSRICTRTGSAFEGTVSSSESHPIEDGSFFFTDYTIRVTKVFRKPPNRALRPGDDIVVGTPGGQMMIDGVLVSAGSNVDAVLTRDRNYLILGNYSAEFRVFDSAAPIFVIDDTTVRAAAQEISVFPSDFNLTGTLARRDVEDRIATAARCGR